MSSATATAQLKEAASNGKIHDSFEPAAPGTILGTHGETLAPKKGFMGRVDQKIGEDVTLKKGTLGLIALGFVLLQVIFNYGGSFMSWARDDQSQKEQMTNMKSQVDETRSDVKELNRKFDEIQKSLQEQALQAAKGEGYKLGVVETQADHGKKVK